MLKTLANLGSGYRTYLVVLIVVILVVLEKAFGIRIPGFDANQDWLTLLLAATGAATMRSAIR